MCKIVKNGGYYRRIGDSTTFEVKKEVDGDKISLDITVQPFTILVSADVQPGIKSLFDEEDWDDIKNLTPDGPYNHDIYEVERTMRIMLLHGGGYKPSIGFYAENRAMLADFVLRVFKVVV
jgi:hypothetical protein